MPPQHADRYLRDVLDIPPPGDVHAGDFTVELSSGFEQTAARVEQYVVTDQIQEALGKALNLVRAAVRGNTSEATYLHGSFGSGKSHFMTVLHAVLNRDQAALDKPRLREVMAPHDDWLQGSRFLMAPYHLINASDLGSALLGGYVHAVHRQLPDAPTPAVYRSDAILDDARENRRIEGDELFLRKLGQGSAPAAPAPDDGDDLPLLGADSGWTGELLDRAFAARPDDPLREALVSALLSGPMKAYTRGASGDAGAFLPLDDGLSVISRHAQSLGYSGIVLFIDELILWLQAHMGDQDFVKNQVGKLVKIIESGNADRPVPIISFVSRQRNLAQLVGEDVTGAEVKNLEAQVEYLTDRFETITLEDRNLPAIIKERVLKPRPGAEAAREAAFGEVEKAGSDVKDALLDAHGSTGADWDDFRGLYPLTPALLNVLVALAGVLQRERTGLKLVQELLSRRRDDLAMGDVIPVGDLWDVLVSGLGGAFTDRLQKEGEQAARFHRKASAHLEAKYAGSTDPAAPADHAGELRLVQTLLLAYLAPNVSTFRQLTGRRLSALNYGSVKRTRTLESARRATRQLTELRSHFGELRGEGDQDPVFALHLSDLDVEPILDSVAEQDRIGARRRWVKKTLLSELGIADTGVGFFERQIVWRGTNRTAELVLGNVCDPRDLGEDAFEPSVPGNIRFVVDYPFDEAGRPHADDVRRARDLARSDRNHHPTLVWMPLHLSTQRAAQLGRLIRIDYLLERDRLDDHASQLSTDDRLRVRGQLMAQRENIANELSATLKQLYGLSKLDEANTDAPPADHDELFISLLPGHRVRLPAGMAFGQAMLELSLGAFDHLYPKHPNLGADRIGKAVTLRELRTVHRWITESMHDGNGRATIDGKDLQLVKRIVHGLGLGDVYDGPLVLSPDWRRRIDQHAVQAGATGDFSVSRMRAWFAEMGYAGLDNAVTDLLISTYALQADRAWVLENAVLSEAPEIGKISGRHALRRQERPGDDEFATALHRAGALFGVAGIPQEVFARNVAKLADQVRERARGATSAVNGVYERLSANRNARILGLDQEPDCPRLLAARRAVDLVERMVRHTEDTLLVRELAAVAYDAKDAEIGSAVATAGTVLEALDGADWAVLDQMEPLSRRDDSVGVRAGRVLDDLARTARESEGTHKLGDALAQAQQQARELVAEALRLANMPAAGTAGGEEPTAPRSAPGPGPAPENGDSREGAAGPADVRLTDNGDPAVPGDTGDSGGSPQPRPAAAEGSATRRIPARGSGSVLESEVTAVLDEIRAFADANPGSEIVVTWHAAGTGGTGGEDA